MPVSWSPSPLIPPFRFGTVEPDVYRGAYPKQRNLRFLKRLKLRTVLSLIPDTPDEVFQVFCAHHGIRSIHLPVDKVKDNVPLTYNRAVEALQIIINQENLPIYVHCLDGASVTGLVICCLRKLQTWNVSSALGEFLRYLRGGVISSDESAFVEKFCSEIEISKPIPPWLWEGQVSFKKHPTLKLHFTLPSASASTPAGSSNTLSATAPSPGWSLQGAMVHFPNQLQSDAHLLDGTINSGSTAGAGDSYFGTVGNSIGGHGAIGSSSTIGPSGVNGAPASLVSPRPGQLSNHVSRFSAKGGSRDRAHVNKSTIRTDIGGSSRAASIPTPTTAVLTQSKRGASGNLSIAKQQQQQQQQDPSQDGSANDLAGSGPGGRSSTLTPKTKSEMDRISGTTRAQSPVGAHTTTSVAQSEHGLGIDGDRGPAGKDVTVGGQKAEENSTDGSIIPGQDRASGIQMGIKNAPAPQEAVDEYYEVSMTLKALSLEGADF
ncbi:hypothetical protein BGX34_005209 [Mortierella sp. NVP85]|nr:hypothetical protein BGX34_005209 [Mortierella sp. NVP85]